MVAHPVWLAKLLDTVVSVFWKTNNNHINHYRAISVWRMEQALTSFHLLAFGRARRRFQQFWRGRWDSVTRMKQVGGWGGGPGWSHRGRARWSHRFSEASGLLERSLFGGGGATSSRGRLSQGRLSHQLGSLGGGKSNQTWTAQSTYLGEYSVGQDRAVVQNNWSKTLPEVVFKLQGWRLCCRHWTRGPM